MLDRKCQRDGAPPDLVALVLACAVAAGACGARAEDVPRIDVLEDGVPIADAYLDMKYAASGGLLQAVEPDGTPALSGPNVDAAVLEARVFYDTVGVPGGGGGTAPQTFDDWKRTFGLSERGPDETLADWRARAGVVVYYNENELGLGRELGCATFADGAGGAADGIACFVTNYGAAFDDAHNALAAAVAGGRPKNTVCISYRPSLGAGYEVQFYVYGPTGARQDWAQLDTLGPRPHPQVCTNCHGGSYDATRHLAARARFLPVDPAVLRFADAPAEVTRQGQEERVRAINELSLRTPLTAAQADLFAGMYGGHVSEPGTVAMPFAPGGWSDTAAHRDLFLGVVKPMCGTCHLAMDESFVGVASPTYAALGSWQSFAAFPVAAYVCGLQMPNAQPTSRQLWRQRAEPVVVGDRTYASAADALLGGSGSGGGVGRAACPDLAASSDCRRGDDPDALCGNAWSGRACDRTTGRCVPTLAEDAPSDPAAATGVCRTDGSRRCPSPQECQAVLGSPAPAPTVDGFDGACFFCGGRGQRTCLSASACADGLAAGADGLCAPAPGSAE